MINNFDFDLIQVPLNVFDTRLIRDGQLARLKEKRIEIHSRSSFLQGLLINLNCLDKSFSEWKNQFNEYSEIVKESKLSFLEYALNFVINIKEIDKVVVGVDSERQLKEIIGSKVSHGELESYPIDDIKLINPSLWKI